MVNKGQSWDAIPTVTTRAHCNERVLSAPPLKAPHCSILSNLCQQGHLRKPEPSLPHNLSSSLLTELTLSPVRSLDPSSNIWKQVRSANSRPRPPAPGTVNINGERLSRWTEGHLPGNDTQQKGTQCWRPVQSLAAGRPSPSGGSRTATSFYTDHHVLLTHSTADTHVGCRLLQPVTSQRVIQVDQKVVETQKPGAQRPAADVLRAEGTSSGRSSQPPALQPGAQLQRWTRHSRRLKKLPWAISDVSLTGCKPCLPPARSSLRRPWEPGQWEPGPVAYLAGGGTRTPIHSLTHT
nr:uncharacterized protein LOC114082868 [Marmota flaviventris]